MSGIITYITLSIILKVNCYIRIDRDDSWILMDSLGSLTCRI